VKLQQTVPANELLLHAHERTGPRMHGHWIAGKQNAFSG